MRGDATATNSRDLSEYVPMLESVVLLGVFGGQQGATARSDYTVHIGSGD